MFADDVVICSESGAQVEEKLKRWRYVMENRGIKISRSKETCLNKRDTSGTMKYRVEVG